MLLNRIALFLLLVQIRPTEQTNFFNSLILCESRLPLYNIEHRQQKDKDRLHEKENKSKEKGKNRERFD